MKEDDVPRLVKSESITGMRTRDNHGFSYICSKCGTTLYHVDSREDDPFLPEPSEVITELKYCPYCGHKLKTPANLDAVKITPEILMLDVVSD
jgi:DNA-directed RNA polymerase subunit RPC12/RpoP